MSGARHELIRRSSRSPPRCACPHVCSYNQALDAVKVAEERFERLGVPHVRPDDYFAEMIKSDKHMTKVRDDLYYFHFPISVAGTSTHAECGVRERR